MKSWAFLLAMALATISAPASAAPVKTDHLEVQLAPDSRSAVPGSTVYVALHQKIQKGWHTYWRNPGDSGQATEITWTLPDGWKAGEPVWPAPHRFVTGPLMNYVYSDEVYLPVPITVPAGAKLGDATLKADAHFLVCSDICVPEDAKLELVLPVAKGAPQPDPTFGAKIAETLAAAPKPDGLKASFENKDGKLTVSITGAAVKGQPVGKAYFYPYEASLIDHAKPQLAEQGPDGLSFTLVPGFAFDEGKSPAEIKGVVSLGEGGVELTAQPGPRLAGSFGTTPPVATTKVDGAPAGDSATPSPGADMNVFAALGLAFVGGLILNLMPCVFPVLSFKAAALAGHGEHPGEARAQGLVFMLGTVVTFLVLAGLLIAARAGGEAVGWGFQLQSPVVVAVLALVMLASGLNLSGVFELGTSVQGAGQGLASKSGLAGSFFTGVLAVVVAAPCTAPFMAGAIGWAMTQPPVVALSVFLALGVGLAAPFTALTFIPALFRKLPKPGAWMTTLRQALAFPMYAAAAWLVWVFATQAGINNLPLMFAAALATAIAAYAWGLGQHAQGSKVWLPRVVAALFLVAAVPLIVVGGKTAPAEASTEAGGSQKASAALPTEAWSPERVAALQAEGRPVFVDFTAAWCVTCQVNERTTLAGKRVADAFAKTNAVYLKADWTNQDATIAKALAEQGRSGVPLYLVYGASGPPKILPQLLTEGLVVDALEGASKPS